MEIDSTFTGCGEAWVDERLVPVKGARRASDGSYFNCKSRSEETLAE